MSLYTDLVRQFHPDVSDHPEAHKRTVQINRYKNNENELKRLARKWRVLGFDKNKEFKFSTCLECEMLKIDAVPMSFNCCGRSCSEEIFMNNGFRFPQCPRDFRYEVR